MFKRVMQGCELGVEAAWQGVGKKDAGTGGVMACVGVVVACCTPESA